MVRKRIDEWEARNAASTLKQAEDIKSNRALLAAAKREITKEQKALQKALTASSPRPRAKARASPALPDFVRPPTTAGSIRTRPCPIVVLAASASPAFI